MHKILKLSHSFKDFDEVELEKISRFLVPMNFKSGEYLVKEGQTAQSLFIVESGAVDILKHSVGGTESHIGEVAMGDIIGEMTFFDSSRRTADLLAHGDVKAYELSFQSLQRLIKEDSDLGIRLYRTISTSLIMKLKRTTVELTEHLVSARLVALGEMATSIAHEINNPMSSILLISGQIKRIVDEPNPNLKVISEYSSRIEKSVEVIARIVNSVRLVSRNGQNDPFTSVKVKEILESTLVLCQGKLKTNSIPVRIQVVPEDLQLSCRTTEISQVILNLISNSCDAIEELNEKWISVEVGDHGEFVQISVTDSGHGIRKDIAEKIFQAFFTTKTSQKGTGIGLSLSKRAIENHQGKIFVNHQSKNTCLVIQLPKKPKNLAR